MLDKFQRLAQLGAGEFKHLNGSLIEHLKNTYKLLKSWHADDVLCDAGLFHAAYGTAGFDVPVLSVEDRHKVSEIIGLQAEEIVYLYCSCDRQYVFESLDNQINFKDRFTDQEFVLTDAQAHSFSELTVANEMELVLSNKEFKSQHGEGLFTLFERLSPWLSEHAINVYKKELG